VHVDTIRNDSIATQAGEICVSITPKYHSNNERRRCIRSDFPLVFSIPVFMIQPVDRYLAALPRGNGKVFLSWRLLEGDASDMGFNVERRIHGDQWEVVSSLPIADSTNFLDETPNEQKYEYRVVALTREGQESSLPVSVNSGAEETIVAVMRH